MFRENGSLYRVSRLVIHITSMLGDNCTTVLPTWWLSCDDGDASRKVLILMHLNKQLQRSLIHQVPVIFSYKPWIVKLKRSLFITVKLRMELLNFSAWVYLKNHGVRIDELGRLLAWSGENGHCINRNKWFEIIPEFKATSSSIKLPFLTVKVSCVSRPITWRPN